MQLNISINKKFLLLILTAFSFLFLTMTIWAESKSVLILLLKDLLVFFLMFSFFILIKNYIRENKISLLSLTYSVLLMLGIMLLSIWLSNLFSENLVKRLTEEISIYSLASNVIGSVYLLLFVFATSYILVVLREFYFANRVKINPVYFKLFLLFGILFGLSSEIFFENLEQIPTAFAVVTVILMLKNSIGISWIAFLSKKEKYKLLIVSIFIAAITGVLIGYASENSIHSETLKTYSLAFYKSSILIFAYVIIYFGIMVFTVLFHLPTAEAYDRKAETVSSLQMFSNLINQVLDFDELADTVTDITLRVSSADASWIVMKNGAEFHPFSEKYISKDDIKEITDYLLYSGECKNLKETKICSLEKSYIKNRLQEQLTSVIISPLKTQAELKGYLFAARKKGLLFYDDEAKAINAFSDYASVALENSRLLKESMEKERLEQELNVAREMQMKLIPAFDPVYDEFKIHSVFIPAFEVGGDFYDYYPDRNDEFSFVIGDVAGKGISAAFVMAEVKGILESLSKLLTSPKDILIRANNILLRTLHRKNFVSAFWGKINLKTSEFIFSRAGHCPMIMIRNGNVIKYQPKGLALGLDFTENFSQNLEEIKLNLLKNDVLIFYTDGITESKDSSDEDFGEERFVQILKENSLSEPEQLAKEIVSKISLFNNNSSQYDDITLLILKWNKN